MQFAEKFLVAACLAVVSGPGASAQSTYFDPGKKLADRLSAESFRDPRPV